MKSNIKTNRCYMYRMEEEMRTNIEYDDEDDNLKLYERQNIPFSQKAYDSIKKRLNKYTEEEVTFEHKYELMGRLITLKKLYL